MEALLQAILNTLNNIFSPLFTAISDKITGLFQGVIDFFISLIYLLSYIYEILKSLFSPVQYLFYYLKEVMAGFTGEIIYSDPIEFSQQARELLEIIPGFAILLGVIGALMCLLIIYGTFKYLAE